MPIERVRYLMAAAALVVVSQLAATRAFADALGCERAIETASGKYLQSRAKLLFKCEDKKVRFKLRDTTVCATDPLFDPARLAIVTRLFATINLGCGGANEDCGDGDDQPLGPAGWGIGQCPGFGGAGCTNPIATCVDVAECLRCVNDAALVQSLGLYYGAFHASEFGTNSEINRCQRSIGKATTKYLVTRAKAMQKCWDARLAGHHANPCPDPGDGTAATKIAKAEVKKRSAICKACGGADGACNGAGDVTPAQVGFASSCPAVTPLYPPSSCGGAIVDAEHVVDCVDCVTRYDADCAGAASVPGVVGALPAACNPGTTTTTTSTIATTTSSTSTSTIPIGSTTSTSTPITSTTSTSTSTTSTSTSSTTPDTTTTSSSTTTVTVASTTSTSLAGGVFDFLSTVASGSCGNTFKDLAGTIPLKNLLCGSLSLGGGLSQVPDNATPSGATNRFSTSCAGSSCTVGPVSPATPAYDCTDTGCLFGTPLPISNAGLSVCVTNSFSAPVSGTLDTSTGDATFDFELSSATVLTGNPSQPCPICAVSVGGAACVGSVASPCTGVCDGSPNQGATCTTKNPNGLTSGCPSPAATVGVQKCYRGTSNGNTCSTGADCPGGLCAQFIGNIPISLNPLTTGTSSLSSATGIFCPGQTATQHGAFKSDICQTGANSGKPCDRNASGQDPAHCGAGVTCRAGTLTNYCSAGTNAGLGCAIASDCGTGGVCSRAGTLAQLVREVGSPTGALTIGVPKLIKLGSAFCVAATSNPTVNANANLPGAGGTSVVGTITLQP